MFEVPTLLELATRARQAFNAYLSGVDAWLSQNNISPTAKVIAGVVYEVLERLNWVADQAFVLYAEKKYLDDHGAQYGIPRLPSSPASGQIVFTATDAVLVPSGTQFTLSNSGIAYQTTSDASLSAAGTLYINVLALAAGSAGDALPNAPLVISDGAGAGLSGPGATSATALVGANGIIGGADDEQDEPYRARILFRLRNPPNGGSASDYVIWGSSVAGVTRVYVERIWRGGGTVRVFPLFDNLFVAQGGVAPQAYIDGVAAALVTEQPAVAIVTVVAPAPAIINVTVRNLDPNTTATQNAVVAELQDMIQRLGRVSGGDQNIGSMPYLAYPVTFPALWVYAAVSNAAGVTSADVPVPAADTVIPAGAVPVLGNVQFVWG